MGLTIATLTDCHLEDIESSKYQPVFASAENVLVKPIFFVDEKKTATPFHWNLPVCIKRNMARKPSSSVVCCRIDKQQLYSRISVWKMYSGANISSYMWPRRRFCQSYFFSGWKKTASPFHSSCVCFCRKTVLPVLIQLTFIGYLLIFQMQWRTTNQGSGGVLLSSSNRHLLTLPRSPIPTVHANSKSNMAGRLKDRELITLAPTNKTPTLQTS